MSVTEIADTQDPVLRNLLITQRYHDFAVALRDGGAGEDATWCAFAVWASKTAGATIRGEVLPERARELFESTTKRAGGVVARFNHMVWTWCAAGSRTTTWPRWRSRSPPTSPSPSLTATSSSSPSWHLSSPSCSTRGRRRPSPADAR